jgi:hypothetical protein
MNRKIPILLCLLLSVLLIMAVRSNVSAARCNVTNVSYSYPHAAAPSQQIDFATGVVGSCASNGEDYYAVRVDLIDLNSNLTISSSDTPIGYNASAFNVTAHNLVTAPASNVTWPVEIHLYVIRAGGTNGAYLLDYQNSTNVSIQVGSTALPEFHLASGVEAFAALIAAVLVLRRVKGKRRQETILG